MHRCHVEAGLPYNCTGTNLLTPEVLAKMLKCSPISYVEQVQASVLIQLGEVDLRCPPSQGKEYYYALLASGKKAK